MKQAPFGFRDPAARKKLAGQLCQDLAAYDSSVAEKFERYELAQDVYDDKEVMSSLDFLEDYEPYGVPLLKIHINGLSQNVCGGFSQASPYLVVKYGRSEYEREAAEKDLHYALELAKFDLRIRQMGKEAGLRARGPVRLTFQQIAPGDGVEGQSIADGPLAYVGLVMDPIPATRFVSYPTNRTSIPTAPMVGHWYEEMAGEVKEKQRAGEYFDDWDPIGTNDSGASTITARPEHASLKNYCLYVLARPGAVSEGDLELEESAEKVLGSRSSVLGAERNPDVDVEATGDPDVGVQATPEPTEVGGPRGLRWYEVILCRTSEEILSIEEWDDPWPPYFAPTFGTDIDEFWPENSPGTELLELQAMINDQVSLGIFGGAQAAFMTVLASNFITDSQTMKIGIGRLIGFKGDPKFTTIGSHFNPSTLSGLAGIIERYADGLVQSSSLGQGQAMGRATTATEIDALTSADVRGSEDQRVNFGDEVLRMGQYALYLLGKNYKLWRKHHAGSIQARTPKCYQGRYSLEINGKSKGNTSQAVIAKVKALTSAVQELKIPVLSDGKPVSTEALFEIVLNALDLQVSTEKIRPSLHPHETHHEPHPENGGIPPFPIADYTPNHLPPELLAGVASQQQMGLPPQLLEQLLAGGAGVPPDAGVGPVGVGGMPGPHPGLPPVVE